MISTVQRFLLFSVLFSSISQLGKHFWPYFAYVSGIRVDYLSPTLYLSDILIGTLFAVSLPSLIFTVRKQKHRIPLTMLFGVLILSISIIVAKYPLPAVYGAIKALEMAFFGYMVSRHISEKDSSLLAFLLSGAIVIEGILVAMQMGTQSSVGGLWYYLGERTFSVASIGISTVPFLGNEILRAYGSFPHPNVLAFFMLMGSLFMMSKLSQVSELRYKIWYGIVLGIAAVSLFSTFSRLTIILFLCISLYFLITRTISRVVGVPIVLLGIVFMGIFIQRFGFHGLYSEDVIYRIDLALIALKIISQQWLFGVGINNYLYYQIDYQRTISPVLLQPPHMIYLLVLLQTGILGFAAVIYYIWKTVLRVKVFLWKQIMSLQGIASILFLCILVIGMNDHYFLTLQQGMIMAAFVIGMVWIRR